MANLKIRVYKTGQAKPETVVTIPLKVLRMATGLLPKKATSALKEEGIDLNEIADLAEEQTLKGTVLKVEKGAENIVIEIAID
jgi:hypothetical protein